MPRPLRGFQAMPTSMELGALMSPLAVAALLAAMAMVPLARVAHGQAPPPLDGTIVEESPCPPRPARTYEQYADSARAGYLRQVGAAKVASGPALAPGDFAQILLTREEFDRREAYAGVECRRILYISDGLKVVGYVWKPRDTGAKPLPLVIFNRGGNRERSKLLPWMAGGFYEFVSRGFVVIGSQYRGVDGGEGSEEYGGADVRDVLNLVPVARSLGYVDMRNVFLFGSSRGGMMTYLALKHGLQSNAAAVISGVTDLAGNAEDHPDYYPGSYGQLIPGYASHPADAMRERSVVAWPERIAVPLLILHGTADTIVSPVRALEFAQQLQRLGRTYELVMYANDGHGLPMNRRDSDRRVVEWFRKYLR